MSKDVMVKLKERKESLTKEFNLLTNEQEKLVEQGKVMNKRLSEIRALQLQLQWSFKEVESMLVEEKPAKVK